MSRFKPAPAGFHAVTPYLTVKGADAAIRFYQQVFGAKEAGRLLMKGEIGHAELQIGDSRIMLSEEMPAWGNQSPATLNGSPVTIALYVEDVDATFACAIEAGATALMPVRDEFYGERAGVLCDPFGHKWHVMSHLEDVSFEEMQKRCDAMFSV